MLMLMLALGGRCVPEMNEFVPRFRFRRNSRSFFVRAARLQRPRGGMRQGDFLFVSPLLLCYLVFSPRVRSVILLSAGSKHQRHFWPFALTDDEGFLWFFHRDVILF